MANTLDSYFGTHEQALRLRSARAQIIAENIANADTPHYKARDIDFAAALSAAKDELNPGELRTTDAAHIGNESGGRFASNMMYRVPQQATLDGNSVDSEFEKSEFMRNAVQYQASLKFIDGKIRTLIAAIRGE